MLENLAPQPLWNYFSQLNAVPRPSKREGRAVQFIQEFGRSLNLEVHVDAVGNVLIRKPGKAGGTPVVLQSHLDMVCQKNVGTEFDFESQGIRMFVDGDWVKARDTSLGADNGIGVAAMMAVLAADDLEHPPLEALFTVDEETGMTGAKALAAGLLQGKVLLNLDTEEDDELTIGCAGGLDIAAHMHCPRRAPASDSSGLRLRLSGLSGGHSGMDIHRGRANANKLTNRLLLSAAVELAEIDGGSLRNAIPRESTAWLAVSRSGRAEFEAHVERTRALFQSEYASTDPELKLELEEAPLPDQVLESVFQKRFLQAIQAVSNGIYRLSPDVPGLVQTSNNLARVQLRDGQFQLQCLCRSALDSEKMDQSESIRSALELLGAEVEFSGAYPGWTPRPEASVIRLMSDLYRGLFQSEPKVTACHAGLECGIIGQNYPEMEMISFGPNIRSVHSPDERVQISSVQKFWRFLTETLRQL